MSTASENSNLPLIIEPRRLARQERHLQGFVSSDKLQRLPEIAREIQSPLEVSLNFYLDEIGRIKLSGELKVNLLLTCQRCLEGVACQLSPAIDLTVLASEDQARGLPKNADWLVVAEETMDLLELLEEEVILAIPLVTLHDEDQCQVPLEFQSQAIESTESIEQNNPFDILAELKKGG